VVAVTARRVWWLVAVGQCLLALSLLRQWLFVGTYRLYLDKRSEPSTSLAARARQRFDLRNGRVQPQILTSEDERLSFPVDFKWRSRLHLRAVPAGRATIEIAIVAKGTRRTLCQRTLFADTEIAQPLPPVTGILELANQGELRWSDPRLVRELDIAPSLLGMALLAFAGLWAGTRPALTLPRSPFSRTLVLGALTAAITASLCLAVLELGLRMMGDRLPEWIAAERRNLGEAHMDGRWQDSPRYGARLRPSLRTFCQWSQGDIVRLGYLPPGLVQHPAYRFPFVTDADGFRNSASEPTERVAALGDSFTDAMTLPAELTWSARLASLLKVGVRNYGTAGFGPGQELGVLKEYVLARHPRWVVVGFFAGNDLQDAERFARFEQDGVSPLSLPQGWKFKEVVAGFDNLYITSLFTGAAGFLRAWNRRTGGSGPSQGLEDYSGDDPASPAAAIPRFDRGLFTIPVAGRTLRFAFLPAYLNNLRFSREQLEAWPGWKLTQKSFREMNGLVRAQGGELVVLFIPHKSQVYLPLLEASFPPSELQRALFECLRTPGQPVDLAVIEHNRLALNGLMRDFCSTEAIAFLDLTNALQAKVATGYNVYFPDDSHWNAGGHEVASVSLSELLRERGL
jgi:hypothetical protein